MFTKVSIEQGTGRAGQHMYSLTDVCNNVNSCGQIKGKDTTAIYSSYNLLKCIPNIVTQLVRSRH